MLKRTEADSVLFSTVNCPSSEAKSLQGCVEHTGTEGG